LFRISENLANLQLIRMAGTGDNNENAEQLRSSNELNIIQLIRQELNTRDETNETVYAATLQNAQNMSAEQIQQVLQGAHTPQGVAGATSAQGMESPATSQALFDRQEDDMEVQELSQGLGSASISEKSQSTNYSPLPMNLLSDSPLRDSGSPPPSVSPAPSLLQDGGTQEMLDYFGQERDDEEKEINDILSNYDPEARPDPSSFRGMEDTSLPVGTFGTMPSLEPRERGSRMNDSRQTETYKKTYDHDSNGSIFSAVSVVRPTPKRRSNRAARRSSLATATSLVNNARDEKAYGEMDDFVMPSLPTQLQQTLTDSVFNKPNDLSRRDICDISTFEMPSSFNEKFANQSAPLRTLQVTESISRERTLNEGINHMFPPPSIPREYRSSRNNFQRKEYSKFGSIKSWKSQDLKSQDWKSFAHREKLSDSRFQPYRNSNSIERSQSRFESQASYEKSYIPKVQNWLRQNSTAGSSFQPERMPFNDATNFEQDLTVFDRIRSRESQQLLHKPNKAEKIFDELDEQYQACKKKLPKKNFRYASSIQLLDPNNFR